MRSRRQALRSVYGFGPESSPRIVDEQALTASSGAASSARPPSRRRRAVALTVAILADAVQLVLWPTLAGRAASPFDDVLDAVVAVILLGTLGFSGRLALAIGMELVPGADLFPTWSAVVLTIPCSKKAEATSPPPRPQSEDA